MKDDSIKKTIPVLFQKLSHFDSSEEDIRFLKVKIWLMHLGLNLNSSYFSKEVVETAIPTLSNTPILAYIEENSEGDDDFSDHRQVLIKKDGKYDVKYIGTAIGVIPSENNAQFEDRLCDDGISRTFLTVEGLIWRKFDDPVDILTRDLIKAESMEIADDYEGEFKEDGYFHFNKFSFFGACGLGIDVKPAMQNATIEIQFSEKDFTKEVNEKMECFKNLFSQNLQSNVIESAKELQEGGKDLDKILEMLKKYSLSMEDLASKDIVAEDFSLEELEVKIQETFKATTEFSLTSEQMERELCRELAEIETLTEIYWDEVYNYPRYYYKDHKPEEKIIIAMDEKNWYLVGMSYQVIGDAVEIDSSTLVRYKVDYNPMDLSGDTENEISDDSIFATLTSKTKTEFMINAKEISLKKQFELEKDTAVSELQSKLLELNAKNEDLALSLSQLQEFKSQYENNEKQEKITEAFNKYSTVLDKEEFESFKEKANVCENVDEFIKDLKSFACDKLLAKTNDNKGGHMFVGIPREVEQKETDDGSVWSRLKNKK